MKKTTKSKKFPFVLESLFLDLQNFEIRRKIIFSVSALYILLIPCALNAQTTVTYNFNTAGQLNTVFNESGPDVANVSESTSGGIGNSGSITVGSVSTNAIFTTKDGYSLGPVGSRYTFESFVKSVYNSGYSGLGFAPASPAPGSAHPYRPNDALGISVHGGGFVFHNGTTDYSGSWGSGSSGSITAVKSSGINDLLNNGSPDDWYRVVFTIERSSITAYDLRVEIWSANQDGSLIRPTEADAIFELNGMANTSITSASAIYSYFSFSGQRVSHFDNYSIQLEGGGTVVTEGNPVVVTTNASLNGSVITVAGEVTDENGSTVTDRGLVYGTATEPTLAQNKVSQGSGAGTFSVDTPALEPGTYYVRTFATNGVGTSYGAEYQLTVSAPPNPPIFTAPQPLEDVAGATSSASFNLNANTSTFRKLGLEFSTDGTRMFSLGFDDNLITEYVLSTPFDITTASFHFELDVSGNGLYPMGLAFNDNGSKLYVYSGATRTIYAYDLAEAFDLSTATIGMDSLDVTTFGNVYVYGLDFNPDGTRLYIVNHDETVLQFELSTPFLVSSASSLGSIDLSARFSQSIYGISFNSNGNQMYIGGYNDANYIIGYDLGVPYDITTATLQPNNGLVLAQPNRPTDIFFSTDRDKLFVLNYGQSQVFEFDLGVAPLTFEENATTPVVDADANDGDGGAADIGITYDLASGGDNDLFSIDAATGVLRFQSAPDFENPLDTNADNMYELTVIATDSDGSTNHPLRLQVTDIYENNPPSFGDAYDISIAQYLDVTATFDVSNEMSSPMDMAFNATGTKLFVMTNAGSDQLFEYDLTIPYDVATASVVQSLTVAGNGTGFAFSSDGTRLFVTGSSIDAVHEYHLSTAFDLSTAVDQGFGERLSVNGQETSPSGLTFNATGSKLYVVGEVSDSVHEYALATNFDVSTASYTTSLNVSAEETNPGGVVFNEDGSKLFVVGYGSSAVHEYNLGTPYDLSTASASGSTLPIGGQDSWSTGLAFNANGTTFYLVGNQNDMIYAYGIGTPTAYSTVENTTAVADFDATDGDGGAADTHVTYSINGIDAALFTIDANTGVLHFNVAADFENPMDVNSDNVYELTVTADDGGMSDNLTHLAIAITVTDVDDTAPEGYTVSIDQDPIISDNDDAISFTFAMAEVGSSYNYTISSDGGGETITGSGIIATATEQVTGIDLSGLGDGTITLSVMLIDVAGNQGSASTDTIQKDTKTEPPIMPSPADNGSSYDQLMLSYTLPEAPLANSVRLIFDAVEDPNTPITLQLADPIAGQQNNFILDVQDLAAVAEVVSSSHNELVNGVAYNVTLVYQDNLGNPEAQVVNTNHELEAIEIESLTLYSDNPRDHLAKVGDRVYVELVTNREIEEAAIQFMGSTIMVTAATAVDINTYRAWITVDGNDDEGAVTLSVTLNPNRERIVSTTTTDGSTVTIDTTAPEPSLAIAENLYFGPFTMQLQFSEPVYDLAPNPVIITPNGNGQPMADIGALEEVSQGLVYNIQVTPLIPGELVFFNENYGIARDAAGNLSLPLGFVNGTFYDLDTDNDGIGDTNDPDDDNDGTPDSEDDFPKDPSEDTDTDGDGIGDNADTDNDDDGYSDEVELIEGTDPTDASSKPLDTDGDGIPDTMDEDEKNDEVSDFDDAFPTDEEPLLVPAQAFTPNGDGNNDAWIIPGIDNYPNNVVKVFNRWGHEVFAIHSYKNNWEGFYKDNREKLPSGSYMYVIDLGDGSKPIQGWLFINY
ncbi:T9SS type B sorting domain-containing protein [Maribacter aurantiacus]|uniref:T9SS type B sorting domain-containing protein n=1 Tax=Maribacter aurantiacus TaxID=1882343 RepID=A0A5R8MC44_9FLAO|nr:T9SS type B sorting domain-containing protein [Maribacter aurantiacus]